jgi:DNA-binding CsgD family transcriptional regulator
VHEQVERAIRLAVASTTVDELVQGSLTSLAQAFGVTGLILYRHAPKGFESHVPPGLFNGMAEYGALASGCPLISVKRKFNPLVAVITDMVEPRAYRQSDVFNEVFHPFGFDRQMMARLNDVPAGTVGSRGLVLCRSKRDREWSRDDEEELRRVRPILAAAVERNARWERMRSERDVLSSMLAKTESTPTLLYGSDGRLLWISRRATDLLSTSLGRNKDLDAPFREAVRNLLSVDASEELPRRITLEVATSGPGAALRAGLFSSRTVDGGEPFVIVALEEPESAAAPLEPIRVEQFGFSKSELAVVRELLTGAGTREIAARLFVSQATVRTHLKHIYEKADVHSRVELIVKLRGLGGGRPSPPADGDSTPG